MKKILFGLSAFTMLFATACQNELDYDTVSEEAVVSFNVGTPEIATRAYSDGSTATVLQYAVYDENGEILKEFTVTEDDGEVIKGSTTVELQLTTGSKYYVIFWAAAPKSPYAVDFEEKTMTVDYNGAISNDESRDAFFKFHEFTVRGKQTETIELKRPFAQLNVGTSDYSLAEKAGYVPTHSTVTVKNIYTTLNLWTGEVEGETAVTYAYNEIPRTETFPVRGYEYLAMNYLLVAKDKALIDVEFACTDDLQNIANVENTKTTTVGSVPVQRNHRTNIYGRLLTSDVDINVVINPEYDDPDEPVYVVRACDELQAALDAAPAGKETIIYLAADIIGDVMDAQQADRHVIIEGGNHKYDGTIRIHNSSNYNNGSITIRNINFETSTPSLNFIMPNDFDTVDGVTRRYSNNVTVKYCSFTAKDDAKNTAVGIQAKSSYNLQVIDCTSTDMHSLIQAQSCGTDVIVKNPTIKGKNGVAFKQVKNAVVEGGKIETDAYGIRFDGNTDNYGILVKNVDVTASQPFIVRRMTGKNNTITLDGENKLTVPAASIATEAPAYQVVITDGEDDAEYVKPTGTYTLTGADYFLVFPEPFSVATWDEFTAALAAGETDIKLTADIEYASNYQLQKAIKLNLGGYSMTLPMINIHTATKILNGTINGKVYARKNSEVIFEKVTFSGAVADNLSTEGHLAIQGGCKSLYAKNCLFSPTSVSGSQTKPLSFEGGSTQMKFEGCEFKSSPYKKQVYLNSLSATGSLDFTNCNFNNKTPNIMFAAACPLTNVTMSGTTKLGSVTFETNRAKEAVTDADLAYLRTLIADNSFSSVRLFYAGGSSEYIR